MLLLFSFFIFIKIHASSFVFIYPALYFHLSFLLIIMSFVPLPSQLLCFISTFLYVLTFKNILLIHPFFFISFIISNHQFQPYKIADLPNLSHTHLYSLLYFPRGFDIPAAVSRPIRPADVTPHVGNTHRNSFFLTLITRRLFILVPAASSSLSPSPARVSSLPQRLAPQNRAHVLLPLLIIHIPDVTHCFPGHSSPMSPVIHPPATRVSPLLTLHSSTHSSFAVYCFIYQLLICPAVAQVLVSGLLEA